MKSIVPTFTATIYIGTKDTEHIWKEEPLRTVHEVCQEYCDAVGLCVTVTPTTFIYSYGDEPGFIVGLINYPRFPSSPGAIKIHALTLAEMLKIEYKQKRVSIVFPNETIMLGDDDG